MEQGVNYIFGSFRLDTKTRLLHQGSLSTKLQPKIYGLLLHFLKNPGRIVSREELFAAVWPGVIVEDSALRLAINTLRRTLQDESKSPQYLQTVCKQGFRWLPEVSTNYINPHPNALEPKRNGRYLPGYDGFSSASENELYVAELLDAYRQTAAGERRLVFLTGESGTGKTRLLELFLSGIADTQFSLLRARCVQLGGDGEPFMPLLEALERRCRESGGKALIEILFRLAPTWLYQILNVLEEHELNTLFPKIAQISSGRMLREGADFFEYQGANFPFVLILDNAHWCDNFTLDLLNFLLFRRSSTCLMLIVSYRSDVYSPGIRRLEAMKEELERHGLYQQLTLNKSLTERFPIESVTIPQLLE